MRNENTRRQGGSNNEKRHLHESFGGNVDSSHGMAGTVHVNASSSPASTTSSITALRIAEH